MKHSSSIPIRFNCYYTFTLFVGSFSCSFCSLHLNNDLIKDIVQHTNQTSKRLAYNWKVAATDRDAWRHTVNSGRIG